MANPTLLNVAALGLALGVSFNPLASLVGSTLAAAVYGPPTAGRDARLWCVTIVLISWLLGDGFRVMARWRDVAEGGVRLLPASALPWTVPVILGLWAAVSLGGGYALPTAVGVFVGKRVVHGTGRVSAAVIAATTALALSALASPISGWLGRLAH